MSGPTSRFEEGDPTSPICLIGEAPSTHEIVKERPFVGPAGNVLEQCLHSAGITRSECYITNVFDDEVFRKGDASDTLYSRKGEKLWTAQKGFTALGLELTRGVRERLQRCSSNVLVPMGGPALSLLTDKVAVTRWRGSIIKSFTNWMPSRKCVPTLHPAASIHGSYVQRYLISADLRRAKEESANPRVQLPERTIIIDPKQSEIETAFLACWAAAEFNTDIECSRGHVSCFSLSWNPNIAISIPIIDEGYKPRWNAEYEATIWKRYAELMGSPKVAKVNQNILFDLSVLALRNRIIPRGIFHDPMIAHSVMNPALQKSLDVICSLHTREPHYKTDNGLDANYNITDFAQHWRYNGLDSAVSLEAWWELKKQLTLQDYWQTYSSTMAVMSPLLYMMVRGLSIDAAALIRTREDVARQIVEICARIQEHIGRPVIVKAPKTAKEKRAVAAVEAININSVPQLKDYFYKQLKLKPFIRSGAASMDDKALAQIYRRDRVPVAKALQDYRALSKLKSTYLEVLLDDDERLRCSYNLRGTWTGRLSSSETVFGTGMNLQNLPDAFQEFLVADYT